MIIKEVYSESEELPVSKILVKQKIKPNKRALQVSRCNTLI
jgi:hypothetical protein